MARRTLWILATLLLVAGCGELSPSTPAEQATNHLRTGRYDEAIVACDQAIVENKDDANAYLTRGRAYQFRGGTGDADRAIADFGESIRLDPNQIEAYYSRAIAYRDQGEVEKSLADDNKARDNDDHLKQIYSHLPETVAPVPFAGADKIPTEEDAASATPTDTSSADYELGESLRKRRDAESAARRENTIGTPTTTRATPNIPKRDRRTANSPLLGQRGLDDQANDDRQGYRPNQPFGTPRTQTYARPKNRNLPLGSFDGQDGDYYEQPGDVTRGGSQRGLSNSRWNDPTAPISRSRAGGRLSDMPRLPSPVQSPFPQLAPRPTGIVEDPVLPPTRTQPRQVFNNPYAPPPTNHAPDYNP